jgi:asparagine synthase (glutamine-hydrolysing)
LSSFLQNLAGDADAAYYADLCFFKPDRTRRLMGRPSDRPVWDSAVFEAVTAPYRRCASADDVQRAQYADLMVYLPNDVLVKVDRMSMLNSLEVRSPLLDRRIIELAFRFPESLKQAGSSGKHLLRRVAAGRLPPALLTAPKRGFSAPVGDWIAKVYNDEYQGEVLSTRARISSLVDLDVARSLFDSHVAGVADHSFPLWALWMLERWLRVADSLKARGSLAGATL